jgi:hypothetical protein
MEQPQETLWLFHWSAFGDLRLALPVLPLTNGGVKHVCDALARACACFQKPEAELLSQALAFLERDLPVFGVAFGADQQKGSTAGEFHPPPDMLDGIPPFH